MAVIFVIVGLVYVFVVGRDSGKPQAAKPPAAQTTEPSILKPVKPAANAPEGVAVESLLSPVKAGENTSINIRTNAGSACTIAVTYNNLPAKDSGLAPKIANDYGFTDWTWTVDPAAPAGTWPVKVTCVYNGKSGVVIGNLEVTKS